MRHFARKMKKWKDKAFAAGVDRKVIEKGAAMMEASLEELIANTIEGMKTVAEPVGLKENPTGTPTVWDVCGTAAWDLRVLKA